MHQRESVRARFYAIENPHIPRFLSSHQKLKILNRPEEIIEASESLVFSQKLKEKESLSVVSSLGSFNVHLILTSSKNWMDCPFFPSVELFINRSKPESFPSTNPWFSKPEESLYFRTIQVIKFPMGNGIFGEKNNRYIIKYRGK